MRRDPLVGERRDHDAFLGNASREAAVSSDDAEDPGPCVVRVLEGTDEVRRDVPFGVAASHGEDEHRVVGPKPRAGEPGGENTLPAVIVDAGRQLGDVVRGRVGLELAELSEVVHGVGCVRGRASDSEHEKAPTRITRGRQCGGHALERNAVEALENPGRLGEVGVGEAHGQRLAGLSRPRGTRRRC